MHFLIYTDFMCSVAKLCLNLLPPVDCSPPNHSVHGISRAMIWNGLPFPSPGDLPDPGIKLMSPTLAGGFSTTKPPGKPKDLIVLI